VLRRVSTAQKAAHKVAMQRPKLSYSCLLPRALFSLDHLIRSVQHRLWNRKTDLLRRLEIDNQFKLRWLLDGKIARLCAFQDLVHVSRSATEVFRIIRCIGYEASSIHVLTSLAHGWCSVLYGKVRNPLGVTIDYGISNQNERVHAPLRRGSKCALHVGVRTSYL